MFFLIKSEEKIGPLYLKIDSSILSINIYNVLYISKVKANLLFLE